MKLKAKGKTIFDNRALETGEIFEATERYAEMLVRCGIAEKAEEPEQPKEARKAKKK